MKLIEARHSANPEVVWVRDLKYNDIVEYDDVPFVDPKTNVIVISVDAKWEHVYVNPQTFNYQETKHDLFWSVELLGTRPQIDQFLEIYFPDYEEDKYEVSQVWDEQGIDRVVKAVQAKKRPVNRNLDEQVTQILEARYHKNPTVDEVYEMYVSLFERVQQRQFGKIVMVEHDYVDDGYFGEEDKCYAVMYLFVLDSTLEDAEQEVIKFMSLMEVPYTDIDIDPGVLKGSPSFKYNRLHTSVMFMGPCPKVTEASYLKKSETTSIERHQVFNLYNKHQSELGTQAEPFIQVRQKRFGDKIFPLLAIWYKHERLGRVEEAREKAIQYMKDNHLPYTSVDVAEKFGQSITVVVFRFGEKEDLKEARYTDTRSVEDVQKEYEKLERELREMNAEGYGYYDSEETGRVTHIHPKIDTEYNPSPTAEFSFLIHRCDNQQQANERLHAFIRKFNIPYNDIEYGRDTGDKKFAFILQYRNPETNPPLAEASYHGGGQLIDFRKYLVDLVDGYGHEEFDTESRWFELETKKSPEELVDILTTKFGKPYIKNHDDMKGYTWSVKGKINLLLWKSRNHKELDSIEAFYHYAFPLNEARYGSVSPEDVNKVHKMYAKLEDRLTGMDDPRMMLKAIADISSGDKEKIAAHLYDDVDKPTFNVDIINDEDGYLTATLSARWTFNAPEPMNKRTEEDRLREFAVALNLPYTDIYVLTEWQDFTTEKIQFSESKLIFKATDK